MRRRERSNTVRESAGDRERDGGRESIVLVRILHHI